MGLRIPWSSGTYDKVLVRKQGARGEPSQACRYTPRTTARREKIGCRLEDQATRRKPSAVRTGVVRTRLPYAQGDCYFELSCESASARGESQDAKRGDSRRLLATSITETQEGRLEATDVMDRGCWTDYEEPRRGFGAKDGAAVVLVTASK